MKKMRLTMLWMSFLLTMTTITHPCTTFYSEAGDVQFCVNNAEPEDDNACPLCGQADCDWTQLSHEEDAQ